MRKLIIAILLSPLLILACSKDEKRTKDYTQKDLQSQQHFAKKEHEIKQAPKKKPIATVNGIEIFEEDLENGNLDLTVRNEVLYQVAVERGIDKIVEPEVTRYERNLILKLIKDELRKGIEPKISDEEIAEYYKNHKHEYTLVEVEELIAGNKELAEEVRKEALKGTDFKQIVELYTKEEGSPVSFLQTSNIVVGVFSEAVDLGQVSQVIESNDQFIVQKVINKSAPGFDDLKDTIAIYLTKEKADNEYASIIEGLKKEKNVEILVKAEKEAAE
jgi:parvulin-like peptidyl-prolyl isomerase